MTDRIVIGANGRKYITQEPTPHDVTTCAICNKPVDKMESIWLPTHFGKLFRVSCHGKTEEQFLSDYDLIGSEVTFGQAFNQPLLEKNT